MTPDYLVRLPNTDKPTWIFKPVEPVKIHMIKSSAEIVDKPKAK